MNPQSLADLLEAEAGRFRASGRPGETCTHSYVHDDATQALLRQAAAEVRGGGWRPIESAPKDGSEFLAVRSNGSGYEVARWSEAEELFFDTSSQFIVPEWLSHWQPLPSPPGAAGEGGLR